jgi:threonine dehydrogenase-like Zn-dependent dehydrogenase
MRNPQIIFAAPNRVEVLDGPAPAAPGPQQVRVRNRYSMVSPGTELACLSGAEWWFALPSPSGYCAVGAIEAVGPGVDAWKVGDLVLHYGSHQAWQVLDLAKDAIFPVPTSVPLHQAPAARLATIAMTALRQSEIELGDTVLVTGLGPVGNLAAQLAALQGARVIGCDLDASRLALARTCGLTDCLAGSPETQVEAMQALTNGEGASVLIEATGRAATAQAALPLLGQNAEVILLGTPRQSCPTDLTGFLMPFHLATRALRLKPAHEWIYPVRHDPFVKHSFTRNTRIVFDLIAAKRLRLDPLITQVVPPSEAPAMYEGLRQRRPDLVGVVFDWQ